MSDEAILKQKIIDRAKKMIQKIIDTTKQNGQKITEEFLSILLLATVLFSLEGFLDEKIFSKHDVLNGIAEYLRNYWFFLSILIPLVLILIYGVFKKRYLKRIINSPAFTFKFDRWVFGIFISLQLYQLATNTDFLNGGLSKQIGVLNLILCCLYFIICIIRRGNLYLKKSNEDEKKNSFCPDNAIETPEEDRLERSDFVNRVVTSINSWKEKDSIIIGLYGEWGTGKTSVLNLMKKNLELEKNTVIVSFNPWYFKDEEQLILQFFNNLIVEIEKNFSGEKSKLISNIKKYSQKITAVTLRAGIVNFSFKDLITMGTDDNDIHSLKKDIESQLEREGKKIIVLIDDLDRLDDKEIHSIFKLVKVIADFHYTTYILSFDEEKVGEILSEQYSGKKQNEIGQSFLEKIIQVPLHLPPADKKVIKDIVFKGIEDILKENKIILSNKALEEWQSGWWRCFDSFPLTIRAAKRYQNSIFFSLPLVKDEVHFEDYLIIEGVRLFLPDIYKCIYRNSNEFLNLSRVSKKSKTYEKYQEEFEKHLDNYSYYQKEKILSILKRLFPENVYSGIKSDNSTEQWNKEKRICTLEYFEKYFIYSVRQGQISDVRFDALITELENNKVENISIKIMDMFNECGYYETIEKFSINIERFNAKQANNLIFCLIKIENPILNNNANNRYGLSFQTVSLICKLVNLQEKNIKQKLVREILEEIESIVFGEQILRFVKIMVSDIELHDIAIEFIERIKKEIKETDFLEVYKEQVPLLLEHWNNWGDRNELSLTVEKWAEEGEIEKLLISFTGQTSTGDVGEFTSTGYNNLKVINVTELVAQTLLKKYSMPTYKLNNPNQFEGMSDQKRVAKQFLLLYQREIEMSKI
ncbi:KAP family P-loop NTPase fold protein [Bacillus cereus]|uniref:KAP family P-loop NTPase fold protein n=1 Tax=Bacillus cereus TaxID=1396 RepID=UPI00094548E2|nr:P-loop NTPase fold protein [Bacillus cereus]